MNKIACFVLFSLWIFTLTGQSLSLTDTTIVKSRSSVVVCFLIGDSNNYKIRWCKDSESHVSSREYPLINGELLTIVDTLEKYVVLFQNCGQKNKYVVLLPLKRSQPEMVFENVLEYDILNKNLMFITKENGKKNVNVTLFNLVTEERHEYQLQKTCSAANPIECIDNVEYKLGQVIISYFGDDDNTIRIKKIRLPTE